jgi:hypothetical protein
MIYVCVGVFYTQIHENDQCTQKTRLFYIPAVLLTKLPHNYAHYMRSYTIQSNIIPECDTVVAYYLYTMLSIKTSYLKPGQYEITRIAITNYVTI